MPRFSRGRRRIGGDRCWSRPTCRRGHCRDRYREMLSLGAVYRDGAWKPDPFARACSAALGHRQLTALARPGQSRPIRARGASKAGRESACCARSLLPAECRDRIAPALNAAAGLTRCKASSSVPQCRCSAYVAANPRRTVPHSGKDRDTLRLTQRYEFTRKLGNLSLFPEEPMSATSRSSGTPPSTGRLGRCAGSRSAVPAIGRAACR